MSDFLSEVPPILLSKHDLDSFIPLLSKEHKPEGYEPAHIALASINSLIWLIRASLYGARTAYSWRNYRVGAAILAYNLQLPAMGISVGANFKPMQDGGPNYHAEQVALAKTREAGLNHVFGIAVWGDPTDTDANPAQSPTLRPCLRCNKMFDEISELRPETLILSGNGDLSICELYTVQELSDYYQNSDPGAPISEIPIYSLADDMDDSTYMEKIYIPHLLPKVLKLYST